MLKNMLLDLQNNLRAYRVLISFSGRFSQGIIEELGDAIRKYMEVEDKPRNSIYNVFAVFVEQTHNIKNYVAEQECSPYYEQIANSGIITIGKTDNRYYVCSGNLIQHKDAGILSSRIDKLIDLDKNELKKLYKEEIKKDLPPGSKGAGVGLIDIARKTSQRIEYSILKLDDNLSFFSIKVQV
ncbi:conserved hypothetical protein [Desulfofarcimen acetoxidans DSM 771]|jgi:hypothetical protein|uniref:Uncharacterized protein n=1 Tax=Desulfofarcimen acetoxidans (strain ATCC 49208 / DSM 771 / KCTC 5769 / VKM B-1644 / 5575) TaxID=485916 RepID=C8VZJ0_DESAS|nr:SiaB family protein kinase [Desulfofarcimen acetoxidans]ACV64935.1 conserved hypothetical protein [Desulfofarcimen acetoxidans DSM 771]